MPWLQLSFDTDHEKSEALSDLLTSAGAVAVTFQDAKDNPIFEPSPGTMPLWQQMILTGLFPAEADMENILAFIQSEHGSLPHYRINPLEDKDWVRSWMDDFKPMSFGSRLWICPSWHTPVDDNAINILLDPGLAFGTGTHPTTALCLSWLDEHFTRPISVIDYGCGSGILGIAASLLGASQVYAVDLDHQALLATRENAKKNQLGDKINTYTVQQFKQQHASLQCELLMANILAGPLIEMSSLLASHVCPGGQIVLSGILLEQQETVIKAYQKWFTIDDITPQEDWIRIIATKFS